MAHASLSSVCLAPALAVFTTGTGPSALPASSAEAKAGPSAFPFQPPKYEATTA